MILQLTCTAGPCLVQSAERRVLRDMNQTQYGCDVASGLTADSWFNITVVRNLWREQMIDHSCRLQ